MIFREKELISFTSGADITDSSFLSWVGYDDKTRQLYVRYLDREDEIRVYFGVAKLVFDELMRRNGTPGASVGSYYNTEVRGNYRTDVFTDFDIEWDGRLGDVDETPRRLATEGVFDVTEATEMPIATTDRNFASLMTGYRAYEVSFSIGGETGSTRVFADTVGGAAGKVTVTLHGLNVDFEITSVVKVS